MISLRPRRMWRTPHRHTSTLSNQPLLFRLPVPKLEDTVQRYLKSIEPFLADLARRRGTSIEYIREEKYKLASDFTQPGGLGHKLQERLKDHDSVSPNNWLNDSIWPRKAYHEQRSSLLINSNWWLLLQDDSTVPLSVRRLNFQPPGSTSQWQIRRAAWLVKRFLDYRDLLEAQVIHSDSSRTGTWFRKPALSLFGITRIPLPSCDALTHPIKALPEFIHLMFREWSYTVQINDQSGQRYSAHQIECQLAEVVKDVKTREDAGEPIVPVGRLTADQRDVWAANREHLILLSEKNREALRRIESSLFTLCLDDHTLPPEPCEHIESHHPDISGHVRNVSSGHHAQNRWFDKSFSLILESNTRFGMMGEHSPVDALIPSIIADWAVAEPIDMDQFLSDSPQNTSRGDGGVLGWQRIDWIADNRIQKECELATDRARVLIDDSDAGVLWFDGYGAEWIKTEASISPDAYIQMALQLAWFKSRGTFTATYETASTRLFLHGRTETIRTLSVESVAFVHGMMNPAVTWSQRYDLLRSASRAHNAATRAAATGKGVDRHLLGLRFQLRDNERSPFFDDELFDESQIWRLSTSGLSAGDRFLGTGFGSYVVDGYGINYLTGAQLLKFGIESKRSSPLTSTEHFKRMITEALADMRQVCIAGKGNHQTLKL